MQHEEAMGNRWAAGAVMPLKPDATPKAAVDALIGAVNAASTVTSAYELQEKFNKYLEWVTAQERMLGNAYDHDEITQMLFTRRYWALNGATFEDFGPSLSMQIDAEVTARVALFEAERKGIERTVGLWSYQPDLSTFADPGVHALVLDTNVVEEHPNELAALAPQWARDAGDHEGAVGIAIAATVVDELDGHKSSNQPMHGTKIQLGSQARAALKELDVYFAGTRSMFQLANPRHPVYAYLQARPLDHAPLSIADNDIVSYALELKPFARKVTLISYDRGICFTAAHLGINTLRLTYPTT